jgi:FkbM family methyltransferase
MSTQKFSQNDEQFVIDELFIKAGIGQGRLLDIGAYVPDQFSNSRALIDKGWSAILVEPSPIPFAALLKHYRANPEVILVNAAVGVDSTWVDFYDSGGDAVSSASQAHVQRWEKSGVSFSRFMLRTIALADLFTQFGSYYDFINLDVESLNINLFRAFPWLRLKDTRVICVEHDSHQKEMTSIAQSVGFELASSNAENLIFFRP